MFALVTWAIFGLLAGSIATAILPTEGPTNKIQTIGIGIAGSIVGGMLYGMIAAESYRPAGLFVSIAGAVACIWAWRQLNKEKP